MFHKGLSSSHQQVKANLTSVVLGFLTLTFVLGFVLFWVFFFKYLHQIYIKLHFQWWPLKIALKSFLFLFFFFKDLMQHIYSLWEGVFCLVLSHFCLILISRTCFDPSFIYVTLGFGWCDSTDVVQVLITGLPLLRCHFNI